VFVVVVTGPPGAGKSKLAAAVHDSLGDDGIANALVELDELERCYPALAEERALAHLAMLCGSFREAGHDLLLITATLESDRHAEAAFAAAGAGERMLVRLEASADTLERRIVAREPERWSGLERLVASARELVETMVSLRGVDLVVDTERQTLATATASVKRALLRRRGG